MTTKNKKWSARARQIITKNLLKNDVRIALDTLKTKVNDSAQRTKSIETLEKIDAHTHEVTTLDSPKTNVNDSAQRAKSIEMLEKIDAHIHKAMLSGVTAYKSHHDTWWSPEIHHAYLTEKFWKLKKIQAATKISMDGPIRLILSQLPMSSPLQQINDDTNILSSLRKAKKDLKHLWQMDGTLRKNFIDKKIPPKE